MKKEIALFFSIILLSLSIVSAINLQVSSNPVMDGYIVEFGDPAIYDLTIKNLGSLDNFKIYSAAGVDISPSESFFIDKDQTITKRITITPGTYLKQNPEFLVFEYVIQDSKGDLKIDRLAMNIVTLANSFSIQSNEITPGSTKAIFNIKNLLLKDFDNVSIKMNSPFFDYTTKISLNSKESKTIEIPLNLEKVKTTVAGEYIIKCQISYNNKTSQKETIIKFLENESLIESEKNSGFLIQKTEIIKRNTGNTEKTVSIVKEKDLISALFTSLNIAATKTQIVGINKKYTWEEKISPGQEVDLIIKTNWLYPILAIILIIVLIYLIRRYVKSDLSVKKNIYYVKTRGGEFALRVHLKIKAKRYIENVKVVDKIPSLVTLYDKFGAIAPDRIDHDNKRIEWDISAINPGEEKVFSYIIYSKIGVVGKFELPPTKISYEREGQLKHAFSNKSFFINKPKHFKM